MTTGRINQVTRRHACKGPGNSNKAEPSETQRNTVAIKILALKRSKDRQTANKFLPPGNVRTLAREASARTRETTRHNTGEDRYSPESTVRCQATVHADAQRKPGQTPFGGPLTRTFHGQRQDFWGPITRTANRSPKDQ